MILKQSGWLLRFSPDSARDNTIWVWREPKLVVFLFSFIMTCLFESCSLAHSRRGVCFVSALDFRPTNQSTPNSGVLPWETFSREEKERHTKRHRIILLILKWSWRSVMKWHLNAIFWGLLIRLVVKIADDTLPLSTWDSCTQLHSWDSTVFGLF